MGEFNWDGEEYTESSSGDFISEDAFNRLVYTDAVVLITAIRDGVSTYNKEERPQWLVDFMTQEGEEFTKGLTKTNEERNARMLRFRATIEANGEPIESTPVKIGKRFDFARPKVS